MHLYILSCVFVYIYIYEYTHFESLVVLLLLANCKCKFPVALFLILIIRLFLFDKRRLQRETASDSVQIKYLSLCQTGLQPHKNTQKE